MRRLIPFALLLVMSVLAVAALGLSVSRNERFSTFATPAAGDPAVVAAFRGVVLRSLDAPSFTFAREIDYRAPDSTRIGSPVSQYLVVGGKEYARITTSATPLYGVTPLSPAGDLVVGPGAAKAALEALVGPTSVTRAGDHFSVTTVVPAADYQSEDPGQVELIRTVYVADDYVTSISSQLRGWISAPVANKDGGYHLGRVEHLSLGSVDYGNYGQVAPISAPPLGERIALVACSSPHAGGPVVGLGLHDLCEKGIVH